MEDYAKRNWTQCEYSHHPTECHKAYHFDDVAIQHDHYQDGYYGTGPQGVVYAIQAAILVLQGQPAPAPFDIRDKREALFLLAHFIGDVHQPLHVGAVYLAANGDLVNRDETGGNHIPTETAGGNLLHFGANEMHADWDGIALGTSPAHDVVCAASQTSALPAALLDRPALWASESVIAAKKAFQGVTFTNAGTQNWNVVFADRKTYISNRDTDQQAQLTKAGARLAEVLNAIWPGGAAPSLHCP